MTKKLTIKGITFPNFGDDDSKKNFRLVFYIGYTDTNGDEAVSIVSKPGEKHWQWRNINKDAFLKPTIKGDSVNLDTLVLKNGDGKKIAAASNKIAEIDGDMTDVTVHFIDVHDTTLGGIFAKDILPELITVWKATGINPIDMAPIPGGVKTIIKGKFNLEDLADQASDFYAKKTGDKTLHSISAEYNGEKSLVLKEANVPWGKGGKTGTYAVTVGVV